MRNLMRFFLVGVIFASFLDFLFLSTTPTFAQPPHESSNSVLQLGPLSVTHKKSTLIIKKINDNTVLKPSLRYLVKNTSPADVKVILFGWSVLAIDDKGDPLFNKGLDVLTGGIPMSRENKDSYNRAFNDKSQFILIAPNQTVELQIYSNDYPKEIKDRDNSFYSTYRPVIYSINASIGIILLDNSTEIRAFSFSDLPISTVTQ